MRKADILICMSQGGFEKYAGMVEERSTLIVDQDLVTPRGVTCTDIFSIPATRLAEEMGKKMMANIVMLGFFTAVSSAVSAAAVRETVRDVVPKGTEDLNVAAFSKGFEFGIATLKGRQKKAEGKKGAR